MNKHQIFNKMPVFLSILLFVLSTLVILAIFNKEGYDYLWHLESAKTLSLKNFFSYYQENTYPLWHVFCSIALQILPFSEGLIVAMVTSVFTMVTYIIVYKWLKQQCNLNDNVWIISILSFFLLILGPLYFPWFNEYYYLGQGTPNTWHNPTNLAVRPFAVISFIYILKIIDNYNEKRQPNLKQYIVLSITLLLSVLAKPSFILMIIPGLGLFMIGTFIKDNKLFGCHMKMILAFIPAVLLFLSQYLMIFVSGRRGDSVGFGWLKVMHLYTPNVMVSFLLAFAFPIYLFVLDFKDSIKDSSVQLSLCCLCSGWLEAAVLLENGRHMSDGNFCWGLYIAMVFVWMTSIKRIIMLTNQRKDRFVLIGWILLVLHICFGAFYMGLLLFHREIAI